MPTFISPSDVDAAIIRYALTAAKLKVPWDQNVMHEVERVLRAEGLIGSLDFYRHFNHFKSALEFDR